jgi:hypothetical protein
MAMPHSTTTTNKTKMAECHCAWPRTIEEQDLQQHRGEEGAGPLLMATAQRTIVENKKTKKTKKHRFPYCLSQMEFMSQT